MDNSNTADGPRRALNTQVASSTETTEMRRTESLAIATRKAAAGGSFSISATSAEVSITNQIPLCAVAQDFVIASGVQQWKSGHPSRRHFHAADLLFHREAPLASLQLRIEGVENSLGNGSPLKPRKLCGGIMNLLILDV